jgi:thiol:disulfide interchange protein DsbD
MHADICRWVRNGVKRYVSHFSGVLQRSEVSAPEDGRAPLSSRQSTPANSVQFLGGFEHLIFGMRKGILLIGAAVGLLSAVSSMAAARTEARLVLAAEAARPGETVMAGVHLKMPPRWHTYWRYGGDAGAPTKIDWSLPDGVTAGDILWPVPEKYKTGDLTSYVYHDQVVLLVPLSLSPTLKPGSLELKTEVSWLECEELCIAGKAQVSAPLRIGQDSKPSGDAKLIEATKAKLPQIGTNVAAKASWEFGDDESRPVVIDWDAGGKPAEADFFPYESTGYEVAGDTGHPEAPARTVRLRKVVKKLEGEWPNALAGLLVKRDAKGGAVQAMEVKLPIARAVAPTRAAAPLASLLAMLGFGLIGGLILNVMPCVLPVIALKVLSFVNQAKETPQRVRQLGLIYGAGVLVSFLVLAGLAIAVQQAGGLAGWSTAFQNPQFRVLITVLMTLVALNLFGVFEITLAGGAMGAASDLAGKSGATGAFFNGVLATVLATPCTAPFLGVAIGFAFTQPALVVVLVFLAVGLGLALPFVLLCWHPAWLKLLPKPGLWMQRFKVAMGFPMLATAVWLFWVTATRLGKTGVLWFGMFLVLFALAAWIWGEFVQRGTRGRGWAMAISLALLVSSYAGILENKLHWRSPLSQNKEGIDWQPWSLQAVEKSRAEGRPVLVDFTADTCLNCKFNLTTSIDIPSVRTKLKEINAATLVGDFTDQNPAIGRELQRYGRGGVPLVLVYPKDADKPPIVLPALLTPTIVLNALEEAGKAGSTPAGALSQSTSANTP